MTTDGVAKSATRNTTTSTGHNDTLRQVIVVVSAVLAIIGGFVGSGAAGGQAVQVASGGALAADATPIAPGGPAFSIWSVIYLGLVAYAIWQALPGQRTIERHRRLGYWVAASLLLNAAWILSVQFDLLPLSVPVIALLLVVLVRAFFITLATRPENLVDTVVTDGTVGLYLGWVCVATAANIAAVLADAGFRGFGLGLDTWGVVIVAVAGAVGVALALRGRGRIAPTLSLSWGLSWVAVARLSGDLESTPTAVAAIVAVIAVVVATIVLRLRERRSPELSARR
ncbi:TspO/MBR family protein [Marisediminicola sp. LYQ85]|uniref:TspO/MBR family protein n=1 Tax=Marisediminicola sp. LYQ85 TaxID=3391062 RepID=UPI00398316B2